MIKAKKYKKLLFSRTKQCRILACKRFSSFNAAFSVKLVNFQNLQKYLILFVSFDNVEYKPFSRESYLYRVALVPKTLTYRNYTWNSNAYLFDLCRYDCGTITPSILLST